MHIALTLSNFSLLLSISLIPHTPTMSALCAAGGPILGDVRCVSSGVIVRHDEDVIIPVEWNMGEQLLWMGEEDWALVPDEVLVGLSNLVVGQVEDAADHHKAQFEGWIGVEDEERADNGGWTLDEIAAHDRLMDEVYG